MFKRLIAGLTALTCLSGPVLAQATCDAKTLSEAIDRYSNDPFGPLAWRMLKGLGDPGVEANSRGGDFWAAQDQFKSLAGGIFPEGVYVKDFAYECRVSYPLQVLSERVKTLGHADPYVKQWVRVQDRVLEACTSGGSIMPELPEPLEVKPELAKLQQQDRAYQEATIAFYRDKPKALTLFKAIGASDSPHKGSARYNVANLLANGKQLAEARAEAKAILADASLAGVHGITKELLGYIANLEDTAEGWTALINDTTAVLEQPVTAITASTDTSNEYAYALNDITYVGVDAKKDDWWLDGKLPENPTLSKALVDTARSNPMVLWMLTGRSADQYTDYGPWSLQGEKWRARLGEMKSKALSLPSAAGIPAGARDMLVAATAGPEDESLWPKAQAVMAAAATSCGTAGETASAAYLLSEAVRVSAQAGKFDEIYRELASLPARDSMAYINGAVLKYGEYLMGQGNLKEARRYRDTLLTTAFLETVRQHSNAYYINAFADQMLWMAEDEKAWTAAMALHGYKTGHQVLNFLPVKKLWQLADDPSYKPSQRALLARVAWTREYALGRKIPESSTAKLEALNPELKATAAKVKADYPKIGPERARLLTILRSPRFGLLVTSPDISDGMDMERADFNEIDSWDVNDKNWWCPFETDRHLGAVRDEYDATSGLSYLYGDDDWSRRRLAAVLDEKLLAELAMKRDVAMKAHPMVKAAGWKELAALAKVPSAPRRLTEAAVRWGKSSAGDDGAPEALALAVRTTRYGCRWNGRHGTYSKAAQTLLQQKFKETAWAKATPYWFDCMYQVWDADYNKVAQCAPKTWKKQPPLR